ncbi:SDR family NAD(P)-dependent oxidoreductase [Paenibacillus sp. H1-7]|uniref:SDR family NAD(P)-dependent oxidoreductase n=1 Tax=Paenibacillus sp. H1-7 TaxID=2282849 RepID=UPI001EF7D2BB|nr:SDR family oxidoreductase [Paenibacillus sp. H1-7]ULL17954.1 SDR family NAD(P)-dependent oxidoreductase [Paenibacillus sp. H1-7]
MKTIIVTGDTGGLGRQIVQTLLKEGNYRVVGISRKENEATASFREKYPERYHHLSYDLSELQSIRKLYLQHLKPLGPIYGLVNNSAMAYDDIVTNINTDALQQMFQVNVFAPMLLTKYAIRDMLFHRTKGSIVHISSVSAHTGYKGLSMYASSKGALEAFSKGTAREWGSLGIRSNCVSPGFMETAMSESLSQEQKNKIYGRTSLKEETDPESVANTVAFLLSEDARSITGTVIHVDNGTI